jgi:AAA+ superfamily predicted ATPase
MLNDLNNFVGGILIGVVGTAIVGWMVYRRWRVPSIGYQLQRHFKSVSLDQIEVQSREFPYRACVDAYQALSNWIEANCRIQSVMGLPITNSFMTSTGIGSLLSNTSEFFGQNASALEYESFDVGEAEPRHCVKHALWLLERNGQNFALLWTSETSHGGCGFQTKLKLDVATRKSDPDQSIAREFFRYLEFAISSAKTYRGKILSLEASSDYRGHSGGIVVHQLRSVPREDVILPDDTVRLLERNIVRFVHQRPELAKLGMPTKKGLLLYGPPGTGKTYTIHYLMGSLPGHTTLLVTGEQVGLLDEYVTLARLLQPSIVVLEDVDLIGRERNGMEVGRESLLNRLLNEMDGLRADAEILFLLTTNRPEALEKALAARPGRVDQAIEFPLPDEAGRRKLIRLYAAGAAISDEVIAHAARVTEGVSASFIKELMRRSIQFNLECRSNGDAVKILQNDIDQAIDELLFAGGSLNRTLLGADGAATDDVSDM